MLYALMVGHWLLVNQSFSRAGFKCMILPSSNASYMYSQHAHSSMLQVSLYLFQDLPLHLWQPSNIDFSVLKSWVLDKELYTVENQLARLIFEKLNWSYTPLVSVVNIAIMLVFSDWSPFVTFILFCCNVDISQ